MNGAKSTLTGIAENPRSEQNTVHSIQAFRGVAALLVVLFHATVLLAAQYQVTPLSGFFLFGFSGIHIFFVLSGFIIFMVHSSDIGKPRKYLTYLTKRFIRIYPTYWVCLAVLSFFYLYGGTITVQDIYQNIGLVKPPPRFINLLCWTLSFEVWFYIIFSVLILNRILGSILIFCWALGVAVTNIFGIQIPFIYHDVFHKYTVLFMIGLASSYVVMNLKYLKSTTKNRLTYAACLGALLIFSSTAFYLHIYKITNWDSWTITLGFGLAGGILMACTLSDKFDEFFRRQRILAELGNASYSIYLLHYPLLMAVISYSKQLFPTTSEPFVSLLFVAICTLAVLAGWLFHWSIERPLLKFSRRHLLPKLVKMKHM